MRHRIISLIVVMTLLLTALPVFAEAANGKTEPCLSSAVIESSGDMLKFGNIDVSIPADDVLSVFPLGEEVIVNVEGFGIFSMPVCASYDDVAAGEMLLRAVSGEDHVTLAISYGQFAAECGLIEKAPEGSETAYVVKDDVSFPIDVTITRKAASFSAPVPADSAQMLKYGHIAINFAADDALSQFSLGDIVTVDLGDFGSYDVPVCANYDDVAAGEMLLRVVSGKDSVTLAINYGQIAMECGLIEKAPEGSETTYVVKDESFFPLTAVVTLKSSASSSANVLGNLIRTDDRSGYPALTDAEFANFRMVQVSGIGENRLYRSSSPINPEIGRNAYADAAAAEAGIKTFINLADTNAEAAAYPGYAESYYAAQNHIFLGLPAAFTSDTFTEGLAKGLRFMIANEGPWLVHCSEGKDRAGITAAILECLMGASYDEVVEDYTVTYRNYYTVENGLQRALTAEEEEAAGNVIISNLSLAFGEKIRSDSDLAVCAENYLTAIGLSADEIETLRELLKP